MSGELDLRGTFLTVLEVLERIAIPHAFIGALPVLAWGRVRVTTDIDVVVIAEGRWERLRDELSKRGFRTGRETGPADTNEDLPDIAAFISTGEVGIRVDVFVAKTSFEHAVIDTARTAEVLGRRVHLARPEASIIYKLLASRPKDIEDVDGIFEARAAAGDALDWAFLDHWAEEWQIADRLNPYRSRFSR